ncbi:MAG: hypothetical protein IKZ53_00600 [Selenomonadaceae bacterium]|nr:hypothetical protein [Selenomonadaceae bacterium]
MDRKYYPLRPIQRWLVDTHFNKANSTMMNIGGLYKLSPSIDLQRLENAINEVLNTYDIFRCRFVFHPETSDLCQTFDNEIMPVVVEEWTDEEFKMIQKYLAEPYDLIGKPLYRVYIFKTPSANYLYVDFYHAIMDGVSTAYLFYREVDRVYRGRKSNRKPLSYAAFIEEESKIPPETLAEGHAYWRKMLAPFDKKKHLPPVDVKGVSAWKQGNFEYTFRRFKEDFFINSGLNENGFFLGATMLTLAKITGSRESIMTWIHNGRTNMREYRIMGLMLQEFPCAFDFHEDISVGEFLDKLSEQSRVGTKYRKSLDVVYDDGLEDECVSFIFQKGIYEDLILADTTAQTIYLPPNEISAVENALDIEINETNEGLYELFLDYDASRYSEALMKKFSITLEETLLLMRNMDRKVSEILD